MKDRRRASRESMAWTSPSGNPKTARQRIGYAATREAAMAAFV
jgi:hypothetical protein